MAPFFSSQVGNSSNRKYPLYGSLPPTEHLNENTSYGGFDENAHSGAPLRYSDGDRSPLKDKGDEQIVLVDAKVRMWNPIWLSDAVLAGFAAWFFLLFFVLITLYIYSQKAGGLADEIESRHYLWTYLPTAIFVITASLWRQVDFYCKELTPWAEMKAGATPGRKSILLDYIDPFVALSLYAAVKNRHWVVVTSTMAFLLLKLATIFSAATLVLTPTLVTQANTPFTVPSVFDKSQFSIANMTQNPVNLYYGTFAHKLPFQYGVRENLTTQTFLFDGSRPAGGNLSALVSGFSSSVTCEKVKMDHFDRVGRPWISIQAPYFVSNFSTSDCKLLGVVIGQGADHGLFYRTGHTQNYQGMFANYTCNDGVVNWNTSYPGYKPPKPTQNPDTRFLLSMADIRWTIDGPNNVSEPTIESWDVASFTGFLCKPSYSIDQYKVELSPDFNALAKAEIIPNTSTLIDGFNTANLAAGIMQSLDFSTFGTGGEDYIIAPVPSMFMLLAGMNNNSRQAAFMSEETLSGLGSRAIQGIGNQIAAQNLMVDRTSNVTGSIVYSRQRLQVKMLTVALLSTVLGLLFILTIVVIFLRPLDVVPSPPETVGFVAAVLASNDKLRQTLRNLSITSSLVELRNGKFYTFVDSAGRFKLETTTVHTISATNKPSGNTKKMWWRPTASSLWLVSCMLVLPLVLIAVLELIQYESDKNLGLAYVDESSTTYRYGVAYVPILVMLGVSTMYNNFDFAMSVINPFSRLKKTPTAASASITCNAFGKLPPHAFLLSVKNRHFAHSLTILATFAASFLTIIASGLYSPRTVPSTQATEIRQADAFNLTHIDTSLGDNFAGSTTALMVQHNLTDPQWTYEDLVFPSFSSPSSPLGANANFSGTSITMKVPALRASLNCTSVGPDAVSVNAFYWAGNTSTFSGSSSSEVDDPGSVKLSMEANFSSSLANISPRAAANLGPAVFAPTLFVNNNTKNDVPKTYIGVGTPVQWLPAGDENDTYVHVWGTSLTQTDLNSIDVEPYYPSFALLFGTASANNTGRVVEQDFAADVKNVTHWDAELDVTAALCAAVLEEVQTEVTLDWPEMTLSQTKPPKPDESSARKITNDDTSGSTWFFDRPGNSSDPTTNQNWFVISLNTFLFALEGDLPTEQTLDAWMTALAYGKEGIPLQELAGYDNREKLFNASSRLYGRYVAQAINFNMRSATPPSGTPLGNHSATFSANGQRLVQNKIPKIILQAVLGFMVLCGMLAFLLSNTKHVLKYAPTSIAGKMMLIANSELCNSRKYIPEGAEWHENSDAFDGWLFSLGSWNADLSRMSVGALPDLRKEKWYGIDIVKGVKQS